MNIDYGEILDCGLGCMSSQSPDRKRTVFSLRGRGIQLMDVDDSDREDMDRRRWSAQWPPDVKYLACRSTTGLDNLQLQLASER